jgi:AcrR family transcriptional regulator
MSTLLQTDTDVKPPRQKRSRKTRNALLDAAERLLRERSWESISTAEIVREAGCSNGAIYGRFAGKDDLLVALYERHDAKLKARFKQQQEQRGPREDDTLTSFLSREFDLLIETMRENRWLLRAMGLLSRSKPGVVTEEMRRERKKIFGKIGSQLLRFEHEIGHPDPKRAVDLAVFFVTTIVRETILYQGPHADTIDLDDGELHASLLRMALEFLGVQTEVNIN